MLKMFLSKSKYRKMFVLENFVDFLKRLFSDRHKRLTNFCPKPDSKFSMLAESLIFHEALGNCH